MRLRIFCPPIWPRFGSALKAMRTEIFKWRQTEPELIQAGQQELARRGNLHSGRFGDSGHFKRRGERSVKAG